ncbi:hypothetical protein [Devosia sp. A449]
MNAKALISALALASALGLSAPAIAQEHMIGGSAVPADQVEAVQAKCDELRAATPAAEATTPAPAAGAETPAAADAAPAAEAAAPAADAQIDLETLTVEMCDEGGFTASAK